jgi:hypothetical protein
MVRELLTDARETSYWILSSLLTAECSTVELPGNRATLFFSFYYSKNIRTMTFRSAAGCSTSCISFSFSRLPIDLGPQHLERGGQGL